MMILTKMPKRHAIASSLSMLLLFWPPMITHASTCAPRHFTLSEAYEAADSIIVGLITECAEERSSDSWASGGDDCSFSSMEVLKESKPARDYSGVTSSSGCGLSLHVGGQYLLFLDSKNQPMHFSATLGGDQFPAQLSNHYLQIIRDFRNGVVDDLAEPWIFGKFEGTCSVRHSVGGNQIGFSRRTADAPQRPKPDWTQETINDETVYRTTVPLFAAGTNSPLGDAEIVAYGDVPDHLDDVLMLRVTLPERPPAAMRQATFSVGARTWSLDRVEITLPFAGPSATTIVEYHVAGDTAEQILSAMIPPSDIEVSATLVASNVNSSPPPEIAEPDQGSLMPAPSDDNFIGPAPPGTSSTRPAVAPGARAAILSATQKEPPQPVLRLESRSTQLSGVIKSFRACYAGDEQ